MIEIAVRRQPASGNVSRSTTSPFVVDITSQSPHEVFPSDEARVQADKLWAQAQTPVSSFLVQTSFHSFSLLSQEEKITLRVYISVFLFVSSSFHFSVYFTHTHTHTHTHKFCLALHLIYVALGVFIIMVIMLIMFSEVSPRVQRSLTKFLLALCPPSGSCY